MRLKPGAHSFTAYLAALIAVGPLSTDMYLPSLPSIERDFGATTGETQLTLSAFLIGMACSQLVYGPLADRFGRKPVLLGGFALYIVASLGAAFAADIDQLIALRLAQAMGGGASVVLARAVVRDLYSNEDAAQMLARMSAAMGAALALAPMLGGVVQAALGWHSIFIFLGAAGAVLALITLVGLAETLPPAFRQSVAPVAILGHYRRLLSNPVYLRYLIIACLGMAGMFSYISGASFVLQKVYGFSPIGFGASFALIVGGYIGGTLLAGKLSKEVGLERTLKLGAAAAGTGGALAVAALAIDGTGYLLVGAMMVYGVSVGLTMPQAIAGALTPFPEIAGTASALFGFLQSTASAIAGVIVGHTLGETGWPMAAMIALMGLGAASIAWIPRRGRA
ncbi:multidrug effflux MFS transporter [Parvibaculum sp.]|uniref:multidrug effflux MFS transporter n=1 Tax=Parvibaculum sp. TaxID=2024848 RepID=UPI0025E4F4E5|nr:multidrug effflux MFS transporter [Parvibaculum sp.]